MALTSLKIPWSHNTAALEICSPEYGLQKEIQTTVEDSYEKCILLSNMPLLDLLFCSLNLLELNGLKQWKFIVSVYRGWNIYSKMSAGSFSLEKH